MPTYSYKCRDCGEVFDLLIGVVADEEEPRCEKCGSHNLEKLITSFGVKSSGSRSDICTTPT
ncbi:hypothetical protein AMJ40_00325 [candidate division TA06 bacterium DG_26]|uniref:Putative regulatory protein FmdB zinc ribbon domain-containing protein n=1 Tax=candidate division TA06 bacterium DG_26 TaxID=1703771 RepID=A0A0S7WMB4_UNCT6|nr:MAG: hypothetical protein AMJ40_00325 [candidate division TA06 bacterium DG_26]